MATGVPLSADAAAVILNLTCKGGFASKQENCFVSLSPVLLGVHDLHGEGDITRCGARVTLGYRAFPRTSPLDLRTGSAQSQEFFAGGDGFFFGGERPEILPTELG